MSNYDPNIPLLRQMLGLSILGRLDEAGITEEPPAPGVNDNVYAEKIFSRSVTRPDDNGRGYMKVMVYTTVVGDGDSVPYEVRGAGKDAIRVSGVYVTKDGKTRGISSDRRVNRNGDIEDIVERMVTRMRDAWKVCREKELCHSCGAPKFTAKSGKSVCAEICWVSPEEKAKSDTEWKYKKKFQNRKRRRYGRRY